MGVSEDVRNLFREFGGHADRYREFGPVGQATPARVAPVTDGEQPPATVIAPQPAQALVQEAESAPLPAGAGSLNSVFARLAGR